MLNRANLVLGLMIMAFVSAPAMASGSKPFFEDNMDRWGADYRSFEVAPSGGPTICHMECARDGQCKSWTYVRPGIEGASGKCKLKDRVPHGKASACCVSGVNIAHPGDLHSSTEKYARPVSSTFSKLVENEGPIAALAYAARTEELEDRAAILQAATLYATKMRALELAENEKPIAYAPPMALTSLR